MLTLRMSVVDLLQKVAEVYHTLAQHKKLVVILVHAMQKQLNEIHKHLARVYRAVPEIVGHPVYHGAVQHIEVKAAESEFFIYLIDRHNAAHSVVIFEFYGYDGVKRRYVIGKFDGAVHLQIVAAGAEVHHVRISVFVRAVFPIHAVKIAAAFLKKRVLCFCHNGSSLRGLSDRYIYHNLNLKKLQYFPKILHKNLILCGGIYFLLVIFPDIFYNKCVWKIRM